ncbi:hypothetical protein WMY93_018253 [Mugilogobius chulae]|uniref:Uncharacterized protein n=1 Tax=Mugilogobius chulae TaxID=88201 RepID=A0AAW0NPV1_9GOBI
MRPERAHSFRAVDKSARAAHSPCADHAAEEAMLGWNEEVQWRGEGPRATLPGAAFRPAAYGAGESWKNFILQTQGIAVLLLTDSESCEHQRPELTTRGAKGTTRRNFYAQPNFTTSSSASADALQNERV